MANTSHFLIPKLNRNSGISADDLNAALDAIDSAIWSSLVYHRVLTSSDDMNSIISEGTGIFYIGNALPLNAPAGFTWSIVIQIKIQNTFVHQYIYKPVAKAMMIREYSGSPTVFGDWNMIGGYTEITRVNYGSNSYFEYWKSGQTGCIKMFYKVDDGSINSWTVKEVGTVPAGFRPAQVIMTRGCVDRASDEGACFSVDSNGSVKVQTRFNSFDSSGDVLQGILTYPIRY